MPNARAINDRQRFRAVAAITCAGLAALVIGLGNYAVGRAPDWMMIAAVITAGTLATTATAYTLTLAGTWWRMTRSGGRKVRA